MNRPTLVVAGVLKQGSQVLIGQRQVGDRHALKWEFPGGKVEPMETPRAALVRELREELGIEAEVGLELARYEQSVLGRPPLILLFLRVDSYTGEPRAVAFEQIVWEDVRELPKYDFLDGDLDFVRRLSRGGIAV
jgi:8-oxo-dGTP diphosphatase